MTDVRKMFRAEDVACWTRYRVGHVKRVELVECHIYIYLLRTFQIKYLPMNVLLGEKLWDL